MPRTIQSLTLTLALVALILVLPQCKNKGLSPIEKVPDEHVAQPAVAATPVVRLTGPSTPSAPIRVSGDARLAVSRGAMKDGEIVATAKIAVGSTIDLAIDPTVITASDSVTAPPTKTADVIDTEPVLEVQAELQTPLTTACITMTSASSGGNMPEMGVATVTAKDISLDTSPPSTTALPAKTSDGSYTESYASDMTEFEEATGYNIPADATNRAGTADDAEPCPSSFFADPPIPPTDPSVLLATQFLDEVLAISGKQRCEISDLAKMLPSIGLVLPGRSAFAERSQEALRAYAGGETLTKGRASSVLARVLKPSSSLVFLILPFDRYAFRSFLGEGVFATSSSPGDVMTGTELLELVAAVTLRYGDRP
ncbi:MAG: hypothetical protein WCL50_02870 [Spirochaetota bacterium]